MALSVKPGREYVLGGKVYKGGDEVPADQVPAKYTALLTSAKGPLSSEAVTRSVDLPKAAPRAEPVVEAAAVEEPMAEPIEEAAPEAPARPSTYSRRDLVAEPAGRTGAAAPSPSSRPAHRRKGKR